jgi:RimJ/RimL family protein N-acetyltransferase
MLAGLRRDWAPMGIATRAAASPRLRRSGWLRQTARMTAIAAPRLSDAEIAVRGLTAADIPALVAACADPSISRWTRVPSPYTREDAERFLAIAATEAAGGDGIALAVCEPAGDRLIGTIGLAVERGRGYAEIGYWTAAPARGRGATTRAVVLVRDWAAGELGLGEIEILAHRDNAASQRVAERAGFSHTGEIRTVPRMPPGKRASYKVYHWRSGAAGSRAGAGAR